MTTVYRPRASAVFAELGDGSGVVLELDSKSYFTLNPTAVFVWRQLAGSPTDVDELARLISEEFDVDAEQARTDVSRVLNTLDAQALIESVTEPD